MYGYPNATQEEKHQIKFFYSEIKEGRKTKLNQTTKDRTEICNLAIKNIGKELKSIQKSCKRRTNNA